MEPALQFQRIIYEFYNQHERSLPWRQSEADGSFDPYKILVSEMMLQQTQVNRVIPKYHSFLDAFPTIDSLASAPLSAVLSQWSGLGYNRRAKYLHEAAKQLRGAAGWQLDDLVACKGIGHNTAAAVLVYTYDQLKLFIETNIRTVYIHHFFPGQTNVHDRDIYRALKITYDYEHPRQFSWALMDYGAHLKQAAGNHARYSQHYKQQSRFTGSTRQLRGQVLRLLVEKQRHLKDLEVLLADDRLNTVLVALQNEGLVTKKDERLYLA